MAHIIMGILLMAIAVCMLVTGIVVAPKIAKLGTHHGFAVDSARYSFPVIMITTAMYYGWIGKLFFEDALGPENYVLELWIIRILLLLACLHFLRAAIKFKV